MATIQQIINRGYLSIGLAGNYNAKQALFSPALASPTSPVLIAMVTNALDWMNSRTEIYSQSDLIQVADYLIWLTGRFGAEASRYTGGGGSVTPITPGGLQPNRIDFIVSDISLIPADGSSYTFTQFIGYNIDFYRSGVAQTPITSESSYFTFNKTTGEFFMSPNAFAGELLTLIPT